MSIPQLPLNLYTARFYPSTEWDNNRSAVDKGSMRAFPISFNYEITAYIVKTYVPNDLSISFLFFLLHGVLLFQMIVKLI